MSSSTLPLTAHQFTEAIKELPLSNLHFKAAEIRNSVAHLVSSNQQLQYFADDGDSDCKEAIDENVVVIRRMEERIKLLKREVEDRGFKWGEGEEDADADMNGNGRAEVERDAVMPDTRDASGTRREIRSTGGRLGDEELARRILEQAGEDEDTDDGVHL